MEETTENVLEIVKKHIIDNGYDGLYNENSECACDINDLRPCWEDMSECKFGFKHPGNDEYDFFILPEKQEQG